MLLRARGRRRARLGLRAGRRRNLDLGRPGPPGPGDKASLPRPRLRRPRSSQASMTVPGGVASRLTQAAQAGTLGLSHGVASGLGGHPDLGNRTQAEARTRSSGRAGGMRRRRSRKRAARAPPAGARVRRRRVTMNLASNRLEVHT